MNIFLNDESLHGQYYDEASFRHAIDRIMAIRSVAKRFERDVHCHYGILERNAAPSITLQQAVGWLTRDERRSVMRWWTQGGPFWTSERGHGPGDWFECRGEVVTDDALGEAAFRMAAGLDCGMVSFSPSDWEMSPLEVVWRRHVEGLEDLRFAVQNFWRSEQLADRLREAAPSLSSWEQLGETSLRHCGNLHFGPQCFEPLRGLPFSGPAAERILWLLRVLDRFATAFDPDGTRSAEGHRIYQDYFTGQNAPFSDSSTTEKSQFRKEMTFRHPSDQNRSVRCTWHGKVRRMTLRIHFSWPVRAASPLYVMYVGPKITRR